MAAAVYPAFKRAIMRKEIDADADQFTAVIVDDSYTYDSAHTDYTNDIQSGEIASKAMSGTGILDLADNAVFDGDDVTFTGVSSGITVTAFVVYHDATGTPVVYRDDADSLPFTTTGADIPFSFSNANSRIFEL